MSKKTFSKQDIEVLSKNKYVRNVIKNSKFTSIVSHLCSIASVSRSGYYRFIKNKSRKFKS